MMRMTSDTTEAKIGRAMKKRLKRMTRSRSGLDCGDAVAMRVRHRERSALRHDLLVGEQALLAADHDPVLGSNALADDAQAVDQRAELDRAPFRHVVAADHI